MIKKKRKVGVWLLFLFTLFMVEFGLKFDFRFMAARFGLMAYLFVIGG